MSQFSPVKNPLRPLTIAVLGALAFSTGAAHASDDSNTEPNPAEVTIEIDSVIDSSESWTSSDASKNAGDNPSSGDYLFVVEPKNNAASVTIGNGGSWTLSGTSFTSEEDADGETQKTTHNYSYVLDGGLIVNEGGSFANGSDLTIKGNTNGKSLTLEEGATATNSGTLTLENGAFDFSSGTFTNSGTLVLGSDTSSGSLTINVPVSASDDDETLPSFSNEKGTIKVVKGTVEIDAQNIDEDLESAPAALKMGNVTVTNGTVTNNDKGYIVKTDGEDTSTSDGDQSQGSAESEYKTRVQFGTVTLTGSEAVFVSYGRETGSMLSLEQGATATLNGTSDWTNLRIDFATGSNQNHSAANVTVGADGELTVETLSVASLGTADIKLGELVSGSGTTTITKGLVLEGFAGQGSLTLSGSSSTDPSTANVELADGADLTIGTALSSAFYKEAETGESGGSLKLSFNKAKDQEKWDASQTNTGTLVIEAYRAKWTEEKTDEEGSTEGKTDEAGDSGASSSGSFTVPSFGAINVQGMSTIKLTGNSGSDPNAPDGKTSDVALSIGSLTLTESWMKAVATVNESDVKPEPEPDGENSGDDSARAGNGSETEFTPDQNKVDNIKKDITTILGLSGSPTPLESEIVNSNLQIGTLTITSNKDGKNQTLELGKFTADEAVTSDDEEAEDPEYKVETDWLQQTSVKLTVSDSDLTIGTYAQDAGAVEVSDSDFIAGKFTLDEGSFTYAGGENGKLLALNSGSATKESITTKWRENQETTTASSILYLGGQVKLGKNTSFTIGSTTGNAGDTQTTFTEGTDADQASEITFNENTEIRFDGAKLGSSALFVGTTVETTKPTEDNGDGTGDAATLADTAPETVTQKGTVTIADDVTVNVNAKNLTWGVYKLFDDETLALDNKGRIKAEGSSATELWQKQLEASGKKIEVNENGEIVVGSASLEGSGLTVGTTNLVNNVLAGNRSSSNGSVLINAALQSGTSVEEISNTINSITGLGAVAGLNAMTVDFSGYVADLIEHHASTVPHDMKGWWVQPLGARLKTDDLSVGSTTTGYKIDTVGIMAGYDFTVPVGDTWGIAFSYQSGDADSQGTALDASTDVKNLGLHLWASRPYGDANLTGLFTYSKTDGETTMNFAGNKLEADLSSTAISFGLRGDLVKQFGIFKTVPHVGARVSMLEMDGYDISVGSQKVWNVTEDKLWLFEVPVGVTLSSAFEYQRWNVQPYVDLTVRGRFGDTDASYTVTDALNNISDTVAYDVSGKFVGDLKIGYMSTFKDLNLGMSYGFSAGDAGRQNHALELTLRLDY